MHFNKLYDVVALGELLIDFTAVGQSEGGRQLFEQNPGGAPANVLSAVARLGLSTALIGKVGRDMHGRFLRDTLCAAGIDTSGLVMDEHVFTTLAFVALHEGEREFSFARKPGADTCLTKEDLNTELIDGAAIFHVGSLSLTDQPSRETTMRALRRAKEAKCLISYDPNYRASLWNTPKIAAARMRSVLPFADAIKLSDEETKLLTDIEDPQGAAKKLAAEGARCVAVTLGKKGAVICVRGACRQVEGYDIPAMDTTGAGDAFWGAFLYQLCKEKVSLDTLTLDEAAGYARFANAAASVCVTRRGGIPAMPSLQEVESLMRQYG